MNRARLSRLKRIRLRNIVVNAVCITIVAIGIGFGIEYFWLGITYESTDDAMIDQYVTPLNIRVAGYIRDVRFTEHQPVKAGDTLLTLDDSELRISVDDATGAYQEAVGERDVLLKSIATADANIGIQDASIAEAKAQLSQRERDYRRYASLLNDESVSGQQYEQVKSDYDVALAHLATLQAQHQSARATHAETKERQTGADANIRRRIADLERARLRLSTRY